MHFASSKLSLAALLLVMAAAALAPGAEAAEKGGAPAKILGHPLVV